MAAAYRAAGRYEDADAHIRWCLARRPDLRHLNEWLKDAAKRRTLVDRNRRERLAKLSEARAALAETTGMQTTTASRESESETSVPSE